nr:bacteriohopanetetrol glucosamine biosynthesis glycosyltransferase HpnI [Paraburkholderia sp. J94]
MMRPPRSYDDLSLKALAMASVGLSLLAMLALDDTATHTVAHFAAWLATVACSVFAAIGVAYTLFAAVLVDRFFKRKAAAPTHFPGITLVKPLHGTEWRLEEHLASFFDQDYPGPVQHVFGVHDANDAALDIVNALRARFPAADIDVVVDSRLYGPNRKVANLVNMLDHVRHDVLCFADSDVSVERDYLRAIAGELEQPGVGIVTCAYRGVAAPGFWTRGSVAATHYQFLPGVITGLAIGRARPCFGQTIAMTRATLDAIGGLAQFSHHLAEDHALGEAARHIGTTVAVPAHLVNHACTEATFTALFTHELRWSRTIRAADRLGHLGSCLMHPVPFALLALLASGGTLAASGMLMLALAARQLLRWRVDRATAQSARGWWLLPMWDIVQFTVYLCSFLSSHVMWRGHRFRVNRAGMLTLSSDE